MGSVLAVIGRAPKSPHGQVWIKMISWLCWIFLEIGGQRQLALHGVLHGAM
tara:strand:+ start:2057 stop:2209 length:153 start_codon:yes stop_codon:yes gene_type:complete